MPAKTRAPFSRPSRDLSNGSKQILPRRNSVMTSSLLFNITTFVYLASMLLFFVFLAARARTVGTAALMTAYLGLLAQTVAIALRWKESYDMGVGHAPLSNLYESVVFFSWTIVLIYA